jgi:hypothetical protein
VRGFTVSVNGVLDDVDVQPATYLTLRRTWQPGDTIDISMPFSIRIERASDRPDTQSIFWGPVLMPISDDGLPNYDVPVQGIESPGHDGLTLLDIVWDQAPFGNHGNFASTVAGTAEEFVARGVFTAAEKDAVVSSAAHAKNELTP